jgi:hypothetical protein
MFGYEGGEPSARLVAMTAERSGARAIWPFLTSLDLSRIHNETQLATMVKDRTGGSAADANRQVRDWFEGYQSRLSDSAAIFDRSIGRWTDDGGAGAVKPRPGAK